MCYLLLRAGRISPKFYQFFRIEIISTALPIEIQAPFYVGNKHF